jgi:hypothetical protein
MTSGRDPKRVHDIASASAAPAGEHCNKLAKKSTFMLDAEGIEPAISA